MRHPAPWFWFPLIAMVFFRGEHGTAAESARQPSTPQTSGLFNRQKSGVIHLAIQMGREELERLRSQPREDVPAVVIEGSATRYKATAHLKGRIGSFRSLDDKPSLTLKFESVQGQGLFHGLSKIHLNNSVEDPSYLHELLGSDLFNAAGVPAPRVTHATVDLNGRALGIYVLKEGFTEEFLRPHFPNATGRLFEPEDGQDIDGVLEEKLVAGQPPISGLQQLRSLSNDPGSTELQAWFERSVDVDRFVTFVALEVLLGHRDGYSIARNNFRVWEDANRGRLVFLPHGMDQLFGSAPPLIDPHFGGRMAQVLTQSPEGRSRYRSRLGSLLTNVFVPATLDARIDSVSRTLAASQKMSREWSTEIAELKVRVHRRHARMQSLLAEPELLPVKFVNGTATLRGWKPFDAPAGGSMREVIQNGGAVELLILAGPQTGASWRKSVRLAPGRYRFQGAARVTGFSPLNYGQSHGAFLRIWTKPPLRSQEIPERSKGSTRSDASQTLAVEFTLASEQTVDLACEFRASAGEARFDEALLQLVQMADRQ